MQMHQNMHPHAHTPHYHAQHNGNHVYYNFQVSTSLIIRLLVFILIPYHYAERSSLFFHRLDHVIFISLESLHLLQETQIRITPPPPYNHHNCQDNTIILNSNLMQSSKPNMDESQGQTVSNIPNVPANGSSNSGSSTNNRRNINRVGDNSSLSVKNAVLRYNRRNNPELEKRRIHHCDFLGKHR